MTTVILAWACICVFLWFCFCCARVEDAQKPGEALLGIIEAGWCVWVFICLIKLICGQGEHPW